LLAHQNPRSRIGELAPEQINQIICVHQQRLIFKTTLEVDPAPLDSIFNQRQTKTPLSTWTLSPLRSGPRPELVPAGSAHLRIRETEFAEVEQVTRRFKHLLKIRSLRSATVRFTPARNSSTS